MKTIKINGKEYKLEYTFEASLCEECMQKANDFMMSTTLAQGEKNLKGVITNMSHTPDVALVCFYAGLLEHHGEEIKTKDDAKNLVKQYFKEHAEDGKGNFYELLTLCLGAMQDDGFFKQSGLEQVMKKTAETLTKKEKIGKK